MAEKELTKTEQGRQQRASEKQARADATQARRDKTAMAQARSEQRVGPNREDNGTAARMSQREAAAGLNLAGNDTMSGRSDSFYAFEGKKNDNSPTDFVVHANTDDRLPISQEAFAAIICVNGKPHYASIQGRIGDEIT